MNRGEDMMKTDKKDLITFKNLKSPISESYRTLRTNIQFSNIDKAIKTLIVTSSTPGEGKSTTISNLANTMAQSDKKVLLIDCDFRKPVIHKKFNISNLYGLTNVLLGDKELEEVIQPIEDIDNLSVITTGAIPPNPAELLASSSMVEILEKLKKEFDMILIDAPPVGLVTDAAVLSTKVDGVLLVVAAKQAEIEVVKSAQDLLKRVNANIIGVVLNKIDINERSYYKYGYYKYYGEEKGN